MPTPSDTPHPRLGSVKARAVLAGAPDRMPINIRLRYRFILVLRQKECGRAGGFPRRAARLALPQRGLVCA
jgi:hypothetical protein